MKVIGRIELKTDEEGCLHEPEYHGGYIVQLTRAEASVIRELQNAIDGFKWDVQTALDRHMPGDRNIEPAIEMVLLFTQTKFALNSLKAEITALEKILTTLEEAREAEIDE